MPLADSLRRSLLSAIFCRSSRVSRGVAAKNKVRATGDCFVQFSAAQVHRRCKGVAQNSRRVTRQNGDCEKDVPRRCTSALSRDTSVCNLKTEEMRSLVACAGMPRHTCVSGERSNATCVHDKQGGALCASVLPCRAAAAGRAAVLWRHPQPAPTNKTFTISIAWCQCDLTTLRHSTAVQPIIATAQPLGYLEAHDDRGPGAPLLWLS